jgi:hypothetical protein
MGTLLHRILGVATLRFHAGGPGSARRRPEHATSPLPVPRTAAASDDTPDFDPDTHRRRLAEAHDDLRHAALVASIRWG